jgi:hypothetical protein
MGVDCTDWSPQLRLFASSELESIKIEWFALSESGKRGQWIWTRMETRHLFHSIRAVKVGWVGGTDD